MDIEYAKKILEETRKNYNLISKDFSGTRNKFWEEMSFISAYVRDGDKVLDLGCGNGRLSEIFQGKKIDYYGVDFSEKLIEIAKKRYPQLKFQVADALNLPFPDNFFDKVYSIAVLHHIPSKELRIQFLRETKRVLKPGGTVILSVWNFPFFKKLASLIKFGKLDSGDVFVSWGRNFFRYVHVFFKQELISLFRQADFKKIKIRKIRRKSSKESNLLAVAEN